MSLKRKGLRLSAGHFEYGRLACSMIGGGDEGRQGPLRTTDGSPGVVGIRPEDGEYRGVRVERRPNGDKPTPKDRGNDQRDSPIGLAEAAMNT